ncbi:trehalose-phosphatase, partial [Aquipuribacter hungaricus]
PVGPGVEDGLAAALQALAGRAPVLLALDFDGVCAPLVDDPAASRMLPGTREALLALAGRGLRVALVSGRALASLVEAASPEPGWLVVGGHGAEVGAEVGAVVADDEVAAVEQVGTPADEPAGPSGPSGPLDPADPVDAAADPGAASLALLDERQAAVLVEITAELEALVASVLADAPGRTGATGATVEHKPTGVVLHTRRADPETALHLTERVVEDLGTREGVHLRRGHDVVELSVVTADKGSALQGLRARTGAAAVLYAGDDVTDEDAFAVLDPAAGDVGVKVGTGPTAAGYRVAAPEDVTVLLRRLLEALPART